MKNLAIILAGGSGERLNNELPKQFIKVAGKSIIEHTVDRFENNENIDGIFIVVNPEYYDKTLHIVKKGEYKKVKKVLKGGKNRQESSRIGINVADENIYENVLIHDAVRPFISDEIINESILKLNKYQAIDVAVKSPDTIISINESDLIDGIPKRKFLRRGQTPQVFKLSLIKKAHSIAVEEGYDKATDDCSLILKYKLADILVIDGSDFNIKITYPIDIHIADKIFQLNNSKIEEVNNILLKQRLKDKVVVVLGGSSGIGKSIIEKSKNLDIKTYNFSFSKGTDIKKYGDCEKALEGVYKREGRVDAVIITASILKLGFVETTDISDIIIQLDTNLKGNILAAKSSIPYLKKSKGHLVFFASSSYTRGREGYSVYSASKAGIVNFAQALSDELMDYGISVNIINPERTDTPMRRNNFGKEDKTALLNPDFVATQTLTLLTKKTTGMIYDIRKKG